MLYLDIEKYLNKGKKLAKAQGYIKLLLFHHRPGLSMLKFFNCTNKTH